MPSTHAASPRTPLRSVLLLLAAAALLCGLWLARHVILLGFFAVVLAVVFSFPVGWLSRVVPRGVAVILTLLLIAGGLTGTWLAAAPTLSSQFGQLSESAPKAIRAARQWLDRLESRPAGGSSPGAQGPAKGGAPAQSAPERLAAVGERAVPAALGVVEALTAVILVIVLAAFLVHEPDLYRRGIRRLVPPEKQTTFDEAWIRVGGGLRRWVGGILVSMSIMGGVTAAGLLAAGIQDWLLLAGLTFLGTFVPYLGAVASAVPGLLVGLAQSTHAFLLALIVYAGVHLVEGYIVEPTVMRRAVELKPALLLFGQAVLGAIFGVLGIVVATPLLVCGQILVEYLWVERRLGQAPP